MQYDLRVERITRFKNARLFDEVSKVGTLVDFCKLLSVPYSSINAFINLSQSPYNRNLQLKPSAQAIVDYLNIQAAELFSTELYVNAKVLRPVTAVLLTNTMEMLPLLAAQRHAAPELLESGAMRREMMASLQHALYKLTPRQQKVIELLYGMNGNLEHTLEETGKEFNLTRESIRRIEARALRQLRENKWRDKDLRAAKEWYTNG